MTFSFSCVCHNFSIQHQTSKEQLHTQPIIFRPALEVDFKVTSWRTFCSIPLCISKEPFYPPPHTLSLQQVFSQNSNIYEWLSVPFLNPEDTLINSINYFFKKNMLVKREHTKKDTWQNNLVLYLQHAHCFCDSLTACQAKTLWWV